MISTLITIGLIILAFWAVARFYLSGEDLSRFDGGGPPANGSGADGQRQPSLGFGLSGLRDRDVGIFQRHRRDAHRQQSHSPEVTIDRRPLQKFAHGGGFSQ